MLSVDNKYYTWQELAKDKDSFYPPTFLIFFLI